jgi:transketolase
VTTMREQAMTTAVDLFQRDERVAIVMADISLDYLQPAVDHDPRRAVNAGIMEQSAVGIAAGFALEGFHPIVHTLAPFLTERPLEQIKVDFGYQGLGATFVSAGAAYDYGESGGTHHAAGDIQVLGSIPGLEVLVPGSAAETDALLRASYANGRPTYLRTSVVENSEPIDLAPGGLTVVRRGAELTVVAAGPFLSRTLDAVDGVDATVLYATTLAPLDADTLARELAAAPKVVLVEPRTKARPSRRSPPRSRTGRPSCSRSVYRDSSSTAMGQARSTTRPWGSTCAGSASGSWRF